MRPSNRRVPIACLAAALAATAPIHAQTPDTAEEPIPAPDAEQAALLYWEGLDLFLDFAYDSALIVLRRARDADPTQLRIHLDLIALTIPQVPGRLRELQTEYAQMDDSPLVDCLRIWVNTGPDNRASAAAALFDLERRNPEEACPVVLLGEVIRHLRPRQEWEPRQLDYLARAVELAPDWNDGTYTTRAL